MTADDLRDHAVVSHDRWIAARTTLLAKEKELTRAKDELNRLRRALPWERVDKTYVFEGPDGKQTLAELFGAKSQLFVYHFMFGPEDQEGCPSCSFWADHYDGAGLHLPHRDVSFVAVSRAPFDKIERYKRRMGWRFKWVSSANTDFNYDFGVSFTPDQVKRGAAPYNYGTIDGAARASRPALQCRDGEPGNARSRRRERVLQGPDRRGVPHVFVLRSRHRDVERHLQHARPGAQGPRRRSR